MNTAFALSAAHNDSYRSLVGATLYGVALAAPVHAGHCGAAGDVSRFALSRDMTARHVWGVHGRSAPHVRPARLARQRDHPRRMSSRRLIHLVTPALVLGGMLVVGPPLLSAASAQALRLVDEDGVVHLTNVPGDPRYRGLVSGTTAGWLRLSARAPGPYAHEIREIASQYNVDPVLVEAVVRTESAFDPTATSRKGAAGLMQLMPGTASALGVLDRFSPRENIRGGVRHLRYLLDRYPGRSRSPSRPTMPASAPWTPMAGSRRTARPSSTYSVCSACPA